MNLDSTIVQIDAYSNYLLISTTTRSVLSDTEKESYKQIGTKLRDGHYGACFVKLVNVGDVRIVCSRPGARLWQVDFDATVTYTYRFRDIATQKPASVIHLGNSNDVHLSVTDYTSAEYDLPEAFNFGKVYFIAERFLLTYTNDVLYVIDPNTSILLFWTNRYSNIRDVKFVNNYLYIQTDNFHIETVFISSLEELILETLFKKQYFFCAELCVHFSEDVLNLITTSNRIHLITILQEKLTDVQCNEKLLPILEKIREFSKTRVQQPIKLEGGIVIVDNAHYVEDKSCASTRDEQQTQDTLQIFKELSTTVTDKLTEGGKTIKEKLQFLEEKVKKLSVEEPMEQSTLNTDTLNSQSDIKLMEPLPLTDMPNIFKTLRKHYELNKINSHVETQRLKDLFGSKEISSVIKLLQGFVDSSLVGNEEREEIQIWCYLQFLKHLARNQIEVDDQIFDYTQSAFFAVNADKQFSCKCGYPLPIARNKMPEFLTIGCNICKFLQAENQSLAEICNKVSYMWKFVLKDLKSPEDLNEILTLIIQFSDEDLIKAFSHKFTYDIWDEASKLLVKLNKGMCLNCDAKIETTGIITWTDFSNLILQSLGGVSTIELLKRYAKWIPNGDLNSTFYQTCIFSTALDNLQQNYRKEAVNLAKEMFSEEGMALQVNFCYIRIKYEIKCFSL